MIEAELCAILDLDAQLNHLREYELAKNWTDRWDLGVEDFLQ